MIPAFPGFMYLVFGGLRQVAFRMLKRSHVGCYAKYFGDDSWWRHDGTVRANGSFDRQFEQRSRPARGFANGQPQLSLLRAPIRILSSSKGRQKWPDPAIMAA